MALPTTNYTSSISKEHIANKYEHTTKISLTYVNKKAQLMLAYPRDAKTMKKNPPFRSYNKFQSSRKSGVYSN